MEKFRKIWDKQKNDFLISTKGMKRKDAYRLFLERFPEADVTETGFYSQRSKVGASNKSFVGGHNRTARPLYSEQVKKGYVRIKIAQPSIWISKAKWVYMETHPWEDFTERSNYVFLDGDTRNFSPDNIERVELKYMGIYNLLGGVEVGRPDITKTRILLAKLQLVQVDVMEKTGLTVRTRDGRRVVKTRRNAWARAYNRREDVKERHIEMRKKYRERLRADPLKYAEYLEKQRKRYRERRSVKKGITI